MPPDLTLAEYNVVVEQCGCCPAPRCCPPQMEYRQRYVRVACGGYVPFINGIPGEEMAFYTRLRETTEEHWFGSASHSSTNPSTGFTYSGSADFDRVNRNVEGYKFRTPVAGVGQYAYLHSCYGSDDTLCHEKHYFLEVWSGSGSASNGISGSFDTRLHVETRLVDIDGSEGSGSEESCQNVTLTDTNDVTGDPFYAASVIGPGAEDPVSEPCSATATTQHQILSRKYNSESTSESGYTYTSEQTRHSDKNRVLSEPLLKADLAAYARARMDDEAVQWVTVNYGRAYFSIHWPRWEFPDSSESEVPAYDPCGALRVNHSVIDSEGFQYRFKLNKCCGYKNIRSEWDEVFFPKAYLEWLETIATMSDESDWPESPGGILVTHKVWEWSGNPPLCNDSDSGSSNSEDDDPFSDESMWSPWSTTVKVPEGEEGVVVLKNYQQRCYQPLTDAMPDVFGIMLTSDSELDQP